MCRRPGGFGFLSPNNTGEHKIRIISSENYNFSISITPTNFNNSKELVFPTINNYITISSEDNIVGYQNPLEGATLTIQPLTPTMKDFCPLNGGLAPLRVIIRGTLRGPYGVPISGGQIQMVIYDAIAFVYIADDTQNPPSLASQTQISNAAGLLK